MLQTTKNCLGEKNSAHKIYLGNYTRNTVQQAAVSGKSTDINDIK